MSNIRLDLDFEERFHFHTWTGSWNLVGDIYLDVNGKLSLAMRRKMNKKGKKGVL